MFARFCSTALMLPAAALLGGVAYAQDYTGTPNYTINDTQTVYDGIGDVTPLPGGTSVLERVLYAVDQLNLTSPGSVAPVNGVYANIAESVALREWYSTDRTEVAYQDYQQDVVTTQSAPIDFAYFSTLQGDETVTLADGTVVNALDVPIGTIRVWEALGQTDPTALESSIYWEGDTLEYQFTARDFGQWFTYDAPTSELATALYRPNEFRINSDGTIDLRFRTGSYTSGRMGETAIIFSVGDQDYRFDTVGPLNEMDPFTYDGITYDFSTDFFGNDSSPLGSFEVPSWQDLQLSRDSGWISSTDAAEGTEFLTYSWDEIVTTDFTRQLDSFYEDWKQREFSTVIDGSVTNVITGVAEATERAVTSAATAIEFTVPTIDIGDIATTALGAVNTGDITVGVNSAVDEASASTTRAVQASLTVVGGSADTGTMMLNVAHNTSIIRGNVENTLVAVNGSVGDISTTALGAVNTGTITSGVNAAVQGIVGMSGQY
ncbi:hypothetical protein PXK05_21190 [Phaeobacter gallaeciensis]|uniref:hypothetical protein n=3 Tax=Phaeobacter gallaeciensis TaxID=60890 RepID=UPI00237F4BFC|nr:hypothetical protein [Phaeobacter gallaeciensis]MDE4155566.1 hypothetical protein [Phaeobacter gallaeciensis]MDE4230959.1 hypothetical protein [Phaeobacter gallaeciensis]